MADNKENSIGEKLKLFFSERGITQEDIARDLNVSQAYVSQMLNGKGFGKSTAKKWGELYKIQPSWLLTGEGEMLNSNNEFKSEVTPIDEGEYMMVEYVDLRASAGKLGAGDVKSLPDKRTRLVPKEYATGKFLVVGVDGDSMNDGTARSLNDGDEILIYQQEGGILDPLPIHKTLFVITSQDGNVLKQITQINREERYIVCHSFNSAYPDFKIYFDDIFQIFTVCKIVQKQISLI